MSCYQKFYSNQIHSSSLMCQLATMWKSQVLCDAIIRTGSIITKAHRLVLVAACPMLQSMENASMGSHLEVRLAPDIKQDSVNTFLQYLYEGFMMLTEENCKDVEKIARLLQVDSIIKCVSDFYKCLSAKTGCHIDDRYKYSSYDLLEFKHIRASSIQKTLHEAALKRGSDFSRPLSPGNKRQRLHRPPSPSDSRLSHRADDTHSMAHSYTQGGQLRDPWDARGRGGARVPPQPGVIDIVEDSIEIIQSDQSDKADGHVKQKSVSVGVTSQYNTATDVRVVSVNDSGGTGTLHSSGAKTHDSQQSTITNSSARGSITVSPLPMFDTSSSPTSVNRNSDSQMDIPSVRPTPPSQPVFPTLTPMPKQPVPILPKPFAAGSASQASSSPSSEAKSSSPANVDHTEKREMANKDDVTSEDGTTPDLKIVKIESNDSLTGGLDMYVDRGEDNILRLQGMEDCQNEDGSDVEHDQSLDWSKEEMSNEGSNVSTDQNNSWYIDQFKEWLISQGEDPNFEGIPASILNRYLCLYYQSKNQEKNPLLGFFALELTRYLTGPPFYRDINIMTNSDFDTSNRILNSSERLGKKMPSHPKTNIAEHSAFITFDHLRQLYSSECLSGNDQFSLQNKVWMDVNLYFGGFTRQHLRDMRKTSFLLENDPNEGRRYYRIVDPRLNASLETRMYEQPGHPSCPVSTMERYLIYLNPDSDVFFQQPCSFEEVKRNANWYSLQPIGKNMHSHRLSAICKNIGIYGQLRNTSVRHLSRQIHSRYPDFTPKYSDKLFSILSGREEDPFNGVYI